MARKFQIKPQRVKLYRAKGRYPTSLLPRILMSVFHPFLPLPAPTDIDAGCGSDLRALGQSKGIFDIDA